MYRPQGWRCDPAGNIAKILRNPWNVEPLVGKEESVGYLGRWLKVQRNYSFARSLSPPDGAPEKVCLYENGLKIYGIFECFSSIQPALPPHEDKEHLSVFFMYAYLHRPTNLLSERVLSLIELRITSRSSTDDAICANDELALRVLSAGLANSMHRKALRGSRTQLRSCLTYMALSCCLLRFYGNCNWETTIFNRLEQDIQPST